MKGDGITRWMGLEPLPSANRLMAGIIAVTVAALCVGALVGGVMWGDAELKAVQGKFKVGDCFRMEPPLHRWEPADGMVFNVDATAYLVVYALALKSNRPIEPAYVGADRAIAAFDRQHEVIGCPDKWR